MTAYLRGPVSAILIFCACGCHRDPAPPPPRTLAEAASVEDLPAAEKFIAAGAKIDQPDQDGNTPLMLSVCGKGTAMTDLLLLHGADVNFRSRGGETPLILAVRVSRDDLVQRLISHGADVNQGDADSESPLLLAGASPRVLRLLLDAGADVRARDLLGRTPLEAVSDLKIAAEMIARGADVNAEDAQHYTPFKGAVLAGDVATVNFLAAHGANVDREGVGAQKLLTDALGSNTDGTLRALVALGVDVNAADAKGNTLLIDPMWPVVDPTRIQWLIDAGADLRRRNNASYTAREWAARTSRFARAEMFECYEKRLANPAVATGSSAHVSVTTQPRWRLWRGSLLGSSEFAHRWWACCSPAC